MAKDRIRVEREYERMRPALRHAYLEKERMIPAELLGSKRFAGRVGSTRAATRYSGMSKRGFVRVRDQESGLDRASRPGGPKGLWLTNDRANDNRWSLARAAIDASEPCRAVSGQSRPLRLDRRQAESAQPELFRAAAAVMPASSVVVAAMDADKAGRELTELVRRAVR